MKYLKSISLYGKQIAYELLAIQILSTLSSTIFKINLLWLDIILFILGLAAFFFLKDFFDEKAQRSFFNITLSQLTLGTVGIINDILWSINHSNILFKIISICTLFGIPIFIYVLMKKPEAQDTIDNVLSINLLDGNTHFQKTKQGDVVLGKDEKTNQEIILPYEDRFVHMLILGPTGCGKTSQIITPMIFSDLKNKEMGLIALEPKGDLAERVFALARLMGREVIYFNPVLKDCPYFNPLMGNEDDVIENLVTTLTMFDNDSKTYFKDNNENLIRRSVKVLKRLYGDEANLNQLDMLMNNTSGYGTSIIHDFSKLPETNPRKKSENNNIVQWFSTEYLPGSGGGGGAQNRSAQKTYEGSSGVRNQIAKLISNPYLNRVLNPPKESELKPGETIEYLNFDKILEEGTVCAICSAQGKLRDLGKFLGYFLILQIQSSVFRRPGNEWNRRGCMFYIDEFQSYANAGFTDMLTQGRSYRVGSVLATQARALIGMNSGHQGRDFTQLVSTNARNVVLFPGANYDDALYYSRQFGEDILVKRNISWSRDKYSLGVASQKETIRDDEKKESRFTPTSIMYKDFGKAIISIIKNKTLQEAKIVDIDFIPKNINDTANAYLDEYNREHLAEGEETAFSELNDEAFIDSVFSIDEPEDLKEFSTKEVTQDDVFDFLKTSQVRNSSKNEPHNANKFSIVKNETDDSFDDM